jgi:hypothetical protein
LLEIFRYLATVSAIVTTWTSYLADWNELSTTWIYVVVKPELLPFPSHCGCLTAEIKASICTTTSWYVSRVILSFYRMVLRFLKESLIMSIYRARREQ